MAQRLSALVELKQWRQRFESGQLHSRGIRQPKLDATERFAVRISSVGVHRQDMSVPMGKWANAPGSAFRGWTHAPLGALYVTSERAFVVGNRPTDIRAQWRWNEQQSVTLLPVPVGVAIRQASGSTDADVVGSEWSPYILGAAPAPLGLLMNWLKVIAAFASSQGRLKQWLQDLETLRP